MNRPPSASRAAASMTWHGAPEPTPEPLTPWDWVRVIRRGVPLGITVFGGLAVLLALRLVERPVFGMSRPVTPWITRGVCRAAFFWLGMARHVRGQPMRGPGAAVANHASWLDIFALNAGDCLYFVAKAEVARWPGIGWLARATGTVFVRRAPREARSQADLLSARLTAGHRLLFFPEGTSTDGQRVLQFKTTLFAPLLSDDLNNDWQVQPITLKYVAPEVSDAAFYGWRGDMAFAGDLLKVLATPKQGHVEVIYHPAVRTSQMRDRKALAAWCEARVREGLEG